jgi:three-Cys-motif partner protein
MSKEKSTRETLHDHSIAKVELYGLYLSIYLNILDRANFVREIIVADLFAGEGIYKNGEKGSPVIAFEAIQEHLNTSKNSKRILFLINDPEKSIIEPTKTKVERIEEYINNNRVHPNLNIRYSKNKFDELVPELLSIIKSMHSNDRALLFIDPWGYKEIRPEDLKQLVANEKVEILLFLPISFMYRFSKTAIEMGFTGSEPLEEFLIELFGRNLETIFEIKTTEMFINTIELKFKEYLKIPYVDEFILTTTDGNIYCLYFFSFNKIGFQKMIESKWRLDKDYGRGINREENFNLFSGAYSKKYDEKVFEYIVNSEGRSNEELFDFGFENRFLPKHTNEILKRLLDNGQIIVESKDGQKVNGFYLADRKRKVLIKKT